jgi:hypothetical protein
MGSRTQRKGGEVSKDQTASPTPRCLIAVDESAPPPWTGLKFTCASCSAEFQLEAADVLEEVPSASDEKRRTFLSPNCWTCDARTVIGIEVVDRPEKRAAAGTETTEGNPS